MIGYIVFVVIFVSLIGASAPEFSTKTNTFMRT